MVVDTSALIARLAGEPERDRFITLLPAADDPVLSAATLVEASIVMLAKTGPEGIGDLDHLLAAAAVRCVAVDATQAQIARDAFARFGRGRSPAGLNTVIVSRMRLAAATNRPLLFTGEEFEHTDITGCGSADT